MSILKVDVAFDRAGTVGEGQPVADGVVVAAQAVGERPQVGQVICQDVRDSLVEAGAVEVDEHARESGDVLGGAVEVRASGQRVLQRDGVVVVEVVGVATAHGGPLEYIEDGVSGLLVAPRDPTAIAAALRRLLTDPVLRARVAVAGRASARRFTLDAMFAGYQDVLSRPARHFGAQRIGAR